MTKKTDWTQVGAIASILALILMGLTYFGIQFALISEESAYTLCTKVSDTEAKCDFYNRGYNPTYLNTPIQIPQFQAWAEQNDIIYDKCEILTASTSGPAGCSCGPGSGSFDCSCCTPQWTSQEKTFSAIGDSCPIEWSNWWTDGDAGCADTGGQAISFSGTLRFFSGSVIPPPECTVVTDCEGKPHIECLGEWSCVDGSCVWTCYSPPECLEGETKQYTCPDGSEVHWCDCVENKWSCIISPENQCDEPTPDYTMLVIIGLGSVFFIAGGIKLLKKKR